MTLEPFPSSVEGLWEREKNLLLREAEQVRELTSSSLNLTMALWPRTFTMVAASLT